jgi:hypothetical protein
MDMVVIKVLEGKKRKFIQLAYVYHLLFRGWTIMINFQGLKELFCMLTVKHTFNKHWNVLDMLKHSGIHEWIIMGLPLEMLLLL